MPKKVGSILSPRDRLRLANRIEAMIVLIENSHDGWTKFKTKEDVINRLQEDLSLRLTEANVGTALATIEHKWSDLVEKAVSPGSFGAQVKNLSEKVAELAASLKQLESTVKVRLDVDNDTIDDLNNRLRSLTNRVTSLETSRPTS